METPRYFGALAGASTATALVIRSTVRVPITEVIAPPSVVASVPSLGWWLLAFVVGALAGGVAARFLARQGAARILHPLLLPGLANLVYVPGALSVVPFLSAFSGPLLDLLLLGSLITVAWLAAEHFAIVPSFSANQVGVAALGIYLLVGYRVQAEVGLTGDEPHYLLIVHSLLRDHDLRVADDYAEGSFREFYDGKIGPHLAHGTPFSVHGIGIPLLLFPGYALLGLLGVLLTEAALGAMAVRELFGAVEELTEDRAAALVAAVGFGATVPALFLATAAYPELAVATLTVALFRRWVSTSPPSAMGAAGWGLAFGSLPFFHIKFFPLVAVFVVGSLVLWTTKRKTMLAGTAVALLGFLAFCYLLLGSPNPLASYGTQRVFWERIPLGLAGLFFDQEFGLLVSSPFYIFALSAVGLFTRRQPVHGWLLLAILGAVALPGAAHPLWSGGSSAPARFLFPALPLLAVAAGALWSWEPRRGLQPWGRTLLIASVLLGAYGAAVPGKFLYLNQRDGTSRLFESLGASWDLTHYLPSLVRADLRSLMLVGAGVGVLLLAAALQFSHKPFRLPPLVLPLLIATCLIDFVSPGRAPESALARWMEDLMWGLPGREAERFVNPPSLGSVGHGEVLGLLDLPLRRAARQGQVDHWRSAPIRLPSGVFVLSSDLPGEVELCNGEGCFEFSGFGRTFRTSVGLASFSVRSGVDRPNLRLRPQRLSRKAVTALQSLALDGGYRLHSLDENVFFEPRGFWVRAGTTARLVLEEKEKRENGREVEAVLSLANGGSENWVEVELPDKVLQFSLRPFETKRIQVSIEKHLALILVTSSSGFRPADLDPASDDHRRLGVFLTAPVFDLSREPSR